MNTYLFSAILIGDTWHKDVYVQVDSKGNIVSLDQEVPYQSKIELVNGYAIPGLPNAHSHAFQYAMAGLAERYDPKHEKDDFWAWREAMYQLALQLSPDHMQAIAEMLYAEMLRHGYTHVAEFHYLHHDIDGNHYANLAEMGERLIAAAQAVGIRITLIPIFYQKGGFGQEANDRQRRFLSRDLAEYQELFSASQKACRFYEGANIAYGIHSMRAVDPGEIFLLSDIVDPDIPIHIHVSEQMREVEDAKTYLDQRPVEWLMNHIELDDAWHLVHATHMNAGEIKSLAERGAHVVLCPSTEGNLGDGLFPLREFQEQGGKWSIGTDSHVGLNPFEELRILDYGQRLNSHRRDSFLPQGHGDNGLSALCNVLTHGRLAMGDAIPASFGPGRPLDALVFDAEAPLLANTSLENLGSTLVYASDASMHLGTMVGGTWKVRRGLHLEVDRIRRTFTQTLKEVRNR